LKYSGLPALVTGSWVSLQIRFGAATAERLMAGLAILKQMHDLSDEVVCERWVENPYLQYFCGEEFFEHRLLFDRSSLTRWRQRMGEEKLLALQQESLADQLLTLLHHV
jgi:transposase, IS5 family